MPHIIFEKNDKYAVALLVKDFAFAGKNLRKHYYEPLVEKGVKADSVIAFSLDATRKTAKPQKEYLASVLPNMEALSIRYLFVMDSAYFKALTGVKNTSCVYGSTYPCKIEGYEHMQVILGVNYQVFIYDPKQKDKLDLSIVSLAEAVTGLLIKKPMVFTERKYFTRDTPPSEFNDALAFLLDQPELAIDIEDISLNVMHTVVGTISFSWNTETAYVFAVASDFDEVGSKIVIDDDYYKNLINKLRTFFSVYEGIKIFHKANYDVKVLIYNLFMRRDPLNHEQMLVGMKHMLNNFDDTKLIAYLATNSTARNELGLKILALPFAGDYGKEDITDITKIPLLELMEYNSIDTVSTFWVKQQYMPIVIQDNQLNIYETLFKPSMKDIVQMELVGVPLNMDRVKEVAAILEKDIAALNKTLADNKFAKILITQLRDQEFEAKHAEWKQKTEPLSYFDYATYNPNSDNQNRQLIYDVIGLPEISFTKGGKPSCDGDTLKDLKNHTKDPTVLEILEALAGLADASIIYNNFINSFLNNSFKKADGMYYLHGNFNLGGTVSGRLSSSDPNLQNIPSTGNKYAKLVKSCVQAPEGYLLVGADFWSLEDRISALTTRDPNKIKVYVEGYDSHCLRAFSYFGDQMPDIDGNSVFSINSIATAYKQLRQDSKPPTFLLTYGGTHHGLIKKCGFTKDMALQIETKYHELYKVSDDWVAAKIQETAKKGYAEVAFGLKVRAPLLSKTVLNTRITPYEAQAEARTVGNAYGQSYGLLNNRAAIEFRERLEATDYQLMVLPIMQVHDAQYMLIKEDINVLTWVNKNLTESMAWQELPEIQHPEVKLGGDLSVFYPTWADETVIQNTATKLEIIQLFRE